MRDLSDYAAQVVEKEDMDAAVVIARKDGVSDISEARSGDTDDDTIGPSLCLLAMYMIYIRDTVRDSGGEADAEGVAAAALERVEASYKEGEDA